MLVALVSYFSVLVVLVRCLQIVVELDGLGVLDCLVEGLVA
jgi:hypothetical protein